MTTIATHILPVQAIVALGEGRVASASPATGLASRHVSEQGALISHALGTSVRTEIRRRKKA